MIGALYRGAVRPALFALEAETAHRVGMRALRAWDFVGGDRSYRTYKSHETHVFGVRFPNPVGLAAGFDKNGVALRAWEALGFGFIEIGTVTAYPQPGNPRPRIFRRPAEAALINRLGFNNDGAQAIAERLARRKAAGRWPSIPVGINLGKSKITPLEEAAADYAESFERLGPFADYVALNVSSPNTPGLRTLQNRDELDGLLKAVQEKNAAGKPVLVKIAPDLELGQIEEIAGLAEGRGLAGIIATNTTKVDLGGLSGRPLRQRSTEVVRFLAGCTKLPIIAAGGVEDAATAREKLDAGAALVQLYTGLVYGGPTLIDEILRGL